MLGLDPGTGMRFWVCHWLRRQGRHGYKALDLSVAEETGPGIGMRLGLPVSEEVGPGTGMRLWICQCPKRWVKHRYEHLVCQ